MNEQILADRKKDIPTIDQVSTILWTPDMGQRLSIARMKMLREQREIGVSLGVTQGMISRIEKGHLRVSEKFTVETLKSVLGNHYSFVIFGTGSHRYNTQIIIKVYWDTRLRINRRNKGAHSKSRVL